MENMNESLAGMLPASMAGLVGPIIALVTIIIGYFIAKIAAGLIASAINRTGLGAKAKSTGGNIGKALSKAVFWVLWLVFILMGLGQFPAVSEALEPINGMLISIFDYLPQFAIGGVVLGIGVMLSKVVKEALSSALEVAQVDRFANRVGIPGDDSDASSTSISGSIGGIVSAIVLIFFAITAIGIWDIPGITDPVSDMLATVLDYIPNIIGAGIILAISVFIGRFVSNLAQSTLPALGVDNSLNSIASLDGSTSSMVPSKIISKVAFVGIVLMGLTAAMNSLGIDQLTNVFETLLEVGGRVVLGAVIIGAGLFIANFISKIVTETSGELAGRIIKYAGMIIFTFMGLNTMNLGSEIVETAFSYSLMAAAVAAGVGGAVAFGLGGREWAAKKLEEWMPSKAKPKAKAPARRK